MTTNETIDKIAGGFETWDSFYSGLTIEQEREFDLMKLYEHYLIDYIKDALSSYADSLVQTNIESRITERKMLVERISSLKRLKKTPIPQINGDVASAFDRHDMNTLAMLWQHTLSDSYNSALVDVVAEIEFPSNTLPLPTKTASV